MESTKLYRTIPAVILLSCFSINDCTNDNDFSNSGTFSFKCSSDTGSRIVNTVGAKWDQGERMYNAIDTKLENLSIHVRFRNRLVSESLYLVCNCVYAPINNSAVTSFGVNDSIYCAISSMNFTLGIVVD